MATVGDNCDSNPTIVQSPAAGTSITSATTITLTASDAAGNSTSCTFTVDPKDTTMPSLACPGDQEPSFDANCEYALLDYTGMATVSDNCDPNPTVVQSPAAGTTITASTTVTITATDAAGNSTSCTFTVDPKDRTIPSLACPADQEPSFDANCEYALLDYTGMATVSDNCDTSPSLVQSPVAGTTITASTTVTITATDAAGNSTSCTFTVDPKDRTVPSLACPGDQEPSFDANCEYALLDYTGMATVSDNCDSNPTVVQSPVAGTTITASTTVTITATDAAGNSTSCTFTVDPKDRTVPSLACPADQEPSFDANCEYALLDYTGMATVSDNCDASPSLVQSPAAGTTITASTTVTITATDAAGNSTSCTFTVDPKDRTIPSLVCPADQEPSFDANCQYTLLDYTGMASISDNCDSNPTVLQSPAAGTTISSLTVVTILVTDASGNFTSCSFTVDPKDRTVPSLTCPGTQEPSFDGNCEYSLLDYTGMASISDNCDANPTVVQSPVAGTTIVGATSVTITATDAAGNSTSCTFTVDPQDTSNPVIACPASQEPDLDENCVYQLLDYTGLATTADNCDPNVTVSQNIAAGTSIATATVITLTATDDAGNTSTCDFTVDPKDRTNPILSCPSTQVVNLDIMCEAALPLYIGLASVSDNCDPSVTLIQNPPAGATLNGVGSTAVSILATDDSGNSTVCTFSVQRVDNIPPKAECLSTTVELDPSGNYTITENDVLDAANTTDNCGLVAFLSSSVTKLDCSNAGSTLPVTVTVTDASGNTAICVADVTVAIGEGLPFPWQNTSIGGVSGDASFDPCEGQFTLSSTGFSTTTQDRNQTVFQELCDNSEIIVRVASVSPGGWAGVVMRETLNPGSRKVALKTQLGFFVRRDVRKVTNGPQQSSQLFRPNRTWLRITRSGNTFIGYTSTNGSIWQTAFTTSVFMTSCVQVGVFVESPNTNTLSTAVFENVSINGTMAGLVTPDVEVPSSLSPIDSDVDFEVYPNPATSTATVTFDQLEEQQFTLTVFNALGQIVYRREYLELEDYMETLDLTNYQQGIYIINIDLQDGRRLSKKLMVRK